MVVGVARLPAIVYQAACANKLAASGNIDVVAYRMYRNNPLGFTVFRAEHHARPDCVGRFLDIDPFTINRNQPIGNAGTAEQAFHQFTAPRTHQTKQADNFAAANG